MFHVEQSNIGGEDQGEPLGGAAQDPRNTSLTVGRASSYDLPSSKAKIVRAAAAPASSAAIRTYVKRGGVRPASPLSPIATSDTVPGTPIPWSRQACCTDAARTSLLQTRALGGSPRRSNLS